MWTRFSRQLPNNPCTPATTSHQVSDETTSTTQAASCRLKRLATSFWFFFAGEEFNIKHMELSQSFMYVITRGLHYTDEFTAGGFGSIDDRSLSLPSHSFLDHYTWPDVSQYLWICKFACNTVIRAVLIRKPYELFPSIWIIAYVCWPAQRRNSVEISNTVFVVTRQVSNIK